jgi:hypothetical protein
LGNNAAVGKQWAVFIAIDRYQEWGPLSNPVRDARELKDILTGNYYVDEIRELYDSQATAANIRRLFDELRQKTALNDSVFIFYAGHGQTDDVTKTGSWIPVDGGRDHFAQANWLPNIQIRNMLTALSARHVFLIADACFSGDILDTSRGASPEINNEYLRRAYSRVSRQVMTSGASETVPDASEFALRLKSILRRSEEPCVDPEQLFVSIRDVKSTQPLLGYIRGSEHQEGGSFLFFRKQAVPVVQTPGVRPSEGRVPMDSAAMRESFNGDWVGSDIRLQINGNRITQYFKNDDGSWFVVKPEKQYFLYDRNNLVYIWLNTGGVWSETQAYSLSIVNNATMNIVWSRHVNNYSDSEPLNNTWHRGGEGELKLITTR